MVQNLVVRSKSLSEEFTTWKVRTIAWKLRTPCFARRKAFTHHGNTIAWKWKWKCEASLSLSRRKAFTHHRSAWHSRRVTVTYHSNLQPTRDPWCISRQHLVLRCTAQGTSQRVNKEILLYSCSWYRSQLLCLLLIPRKNQASSSTWYTCQAIIAWCYVRASHALLRTATPIKTVM